MKTILKKPAKFKITCPKCGCQFIYDKEDIVAQALVEMVECPSCYKLLWHSDGSFYYEDSAEVKNEQFKDFNR